MLAKIDGPFSQAVGVSLELNSIFDHLMSWKTYGLSMRAGFSGITFDLGSPALTCFSMKYKTGPKDSDRKSILLKSYESTGPREHKVSCSSNVSSDGPKH